MLHISGSNSEKTVASYYLFILPYFALMPFAFYVKDFELPCCWNMIYKALSTFLKIKENQLFWANIRKNIKLQDAMYSPADQCFHVTSFCVWVDVVKVIPSEEKKNQLIRNPFDPLINSLNLTLDRRDLWQLIRGQLHLRSVNSITMTKRKDNGKLQGKSHVKIIDCHL